MLDEKDKVEEENPNENGVPTNTESEDEPLEIISDDNISVITNGDTKKRNCLYGIRCIG